MDNPSPVPVNAYISCSDADQDWVESWLCPRLTRAGLSVLVSYELPSGRSKVDVISEVIARSHRTVVVLTPAWVRDEWQNFEGAIAVLGDLAAHRGKVIPLLLQDCDVPAHIAFRQPRDFRRKKNWESQCQRLITDIQNAIPAPFPIPLPPQPWAAWRKWLRRNRLRLGLGIGGLVVALLALMAIAEIPKFPGWRVVSPPLKGAWRLERVGDDLLVASNTDFASVGNGNYVLWRSADQGSTWPPVLVPQVHIGNIDEAFEDFSSTADAALLYGAARTAGLLASDDHGATWRPVKTLPLSYAFAVAAAPDDPALVFVSDADGGLARSTDRGQTWTRLDGSTACVNPGAGAQALPKMQVQWRLLATPGYIFAASYRNPRLDLGSTALPPGAGIFASRDRGNCWTLVFDAETRYIATALAAVPNQPALLLFAALDYLTPSSEIGPFDCERRTTVNTVDVRVRQPLTLLETPGLFQGLLSPDGSQWYASNNCGQVWTGSVQQPGARNLRAIGLCRAFAKCYNDLAIDPLLSSKPKPAPPLLLAADYVYRYSEVSWLRALWP